MYLRSLRTSLHWVQAPPTKKGSMGTVQRQWRYKTLGDRSWYFYFANMLILLIDIGGTIMKRRKTKERFQRLNLKFENTPIEKAKIEIYSDRTTQLGLKMFDENNNEINTVISEIECYYERENKSDKVLYTQPSLDESVDDVNLELLKYDVIIVIDTSYDDFNNSNFAFTSILICAKLPTNDGSIIYQQTSEILEWDATLVDKPENLMYAHVIEITRLHNLKNNQFPSMAVIIDSDLENIAFFNDRTMPIYADYFLPKSFTLFYASSDVGSEYLPNKLMKICDKEAKLALAEFRNEFQNIK